MKAVSLLSGGLDSTVLAYFLKDNGHDLHCLSFGYGQRHEKELFQAVDIAGQLGVEHHIVTIGVDELEEANEPVSKILSGSSLTDESVDVPEGHYAEENMKATVVPNRNAIMLSIAYGVAIADGAGIVAFAAHAGDHAIYPDCRPEFVEALNTALAIGNEWADPIPYVTGPFLNLSKANIVELGAKLDVPFELTWSCYKGGEFHCGRCGTCVERAEAFHDAKVKDPTHYKDPHFWEDAVAKAAKGV